MIEFKVPAAERAKWSEDKPELSKLFAQICEEEGLAPELAQRLIARCDLIVHNYLPVIGPAVFQRGAAAGYAAGVKNGSQLDRAIEAWLALRPKPTAAAPRGRGRPLTPPPALFPAVKVDGTGLPILGVDKIVN